MIQEFNVNTKKAAIWLVDIIVARELVSERTRKVAAMTLDYHAFSLATDLYLHWNTCITI